MCSMRWVALHPCGQVASLGMLLLVLRETTNTMVRGPPGVALLRIAHPSSAGVYHTPVTNCVATAIASNVAVHTKMIKTRPRARPSPRWVHGCGGAGWWWMDVMKLSWRDKPTESLYSARYFLISFDERLLRVCSKAFKAFFFSLMRGDTWKRLDQSPCVAQTPPASHSLSSYVIYGVSILNSYFLSNMNRRCYSKILLLNQRAVPQSKN